MIAIPYIVGQSIIKGTLYVYEGKYWTALQNRTIGTIPKPNTIWQEYVEVKQPDTTDKFALFSSKFSQLIDKIIMAVPTKYRSTLLQFKLLGLDPEQVVITPELEQEVADAFAEVVVAERYLNPINVALNSTESQIIAALNAAYPSETSGAAVIVTGSKVDSNGESVSVSYIKGTTTWAKNPNFYPNVTAQVPGLATPDIRDFIDKAPAADKLVSVDDTDIVFPGSVKGLTKLPGQKDIKEFTTLEELNRDRHKLVPSNLAYVSTYTIVFNTDTVKTMSLNGDIIMNLGTTVANNFPQIIKLKAGTAQRKITINPAAQVWAESNVIFLPAGKEMQVFATPYGNIITDVVITFITKP